MNDFYEWYEGDSIRKLFFLIKLRKFMNEVNDVFKAKDKDFLNMLKISEAIGLDVYIVVTDKTIKRKA